MVSFRSLAAAAILLSAPAAALAQQGEQVVAGDATVGRPDPLTTIINQLTGKAIINWDSFGVADGALVQFNQPTGGVVLNRVVGGDPSQILGSLQANGSVFLLNPNGILFGAGATVDVGALVASTLTISDTDFMAGQYRLVQDPTKPLSYVINQGAINAGDYAALVAPLVENSGSITSLGGTVYLLGASEAVLTIQGSELIGYSIGTATGGTIHIQAGALSDPVRAVVNFAGLVEAGGVIDDGSGMVQLVGAEGLVVNTGSITVSGFDTTAAGRIGLDSSMATATFATSVLEANGTGLGADAGTIRVLSKRNTYYNGWAQADAFAWGAGGFIEVSAPVNFYWLKGSASAGSVDGPGGTIYIDPTTINIINGAGPGTFDGLMGDFQLLNSETMAAGTLSEAVLQGLAGTSSIIVEASQTITFENLTDNTLTLQTNSANSVTFRTTTTSGSGIVFNDPTNDTITTAGGSLIMDSFTNISIGNVNVGVGSITLRAYSNITARNLTANAAAPGRITVWSDWNLDGVGSAFQVNTVGLSWSAYEVAIRAADGIYRVGATTSPIQVNATRLQVSNTAPTVTLASGNAYVTDSAGGVDMRDILGLGYAARQDGSGSLLRIEAVSGNLILSGSFLSTNSGRFEVRTTTSGNIVDDGLQTTFISTNNSTTNPAINLASAGSIGAVGSGGTYFNNFVDIQGNGGVMYVQASSVGNIYVSWVGAAGTVNTNYMSNTWNPSGAGQQVHIANLVGGITHTTGGNTSMWTGSDDNIYLYCTGDFSMTTGTFGNTGSLASFNVHADGNISMTGGTINALGTRQLFSDSNATTISGVLFTGNGFIAADGTGSYSQSAGTHGGSGSLYISAAGGITVTGGAMNVPSLKLENRSSGAITWTDTGTVGVNLTNLGTGSAISSVGGPISFVHSGSIIVSSNIPAAGTTTTLQSTTGSITQIGGTITATNLVLRSATGISVTGISVTNLQLQVSGAGTISVLTSGALTLSDIASLGYAVSNTGGSTTISTSGNLVVASGITATGQVLGLITSGGTVTQTGGTISATTLAVGATTGVNLPTVAITNLGVNNSVSGTVTVSATGSMALFDIIAAGGGAVNLTAATSILDDGNQSTGITTTGTINLIATAGSIGTFGGSNFDGFVDVNPGFGALNATAATNLFISQIGAGALSSSQLGNFDATGSGGTQGLVNLGGNLTINDGEFNGLDDAILFGSSGNLTFSSAVSTTAGTITAHADGTITISASLTAGTTISLTADSTFFGSDGTGNINRTAGTITAPNLVLDAASGITIAAGGAVGTLDAINRTSGVITFANTGDLTILNVSNAAGGAIALSSIGSLLDDGLQTTSITTSGTITLTATGAIGAFTGGNFDMFIDVAGGFGTLNATGTNVYVSQVGAGNLTSGQIGNFDATTAGGTQALVNLVGDLTVNDGEFSGLNDLLILGASGNLAISSAVSTTAGTVTLLADGTVTLGAGVTAGTTIEVQADAAIFGSDGTGAVTQTGGVLTATNLIAVAGGGITLNNLAVTNLSATNATSGVISITGSAGTLTLSDLGYGYAVLNSAGGVTVNVAGSLILASGVTAGGPVSLTSAGSITQTGGTLTGGALTLSSGTGMSLGSLSVSSATGTNSGAGDVTLGFNGATALGTISNAGGNLSISMSGSLSLGSGVTAGGAVTLNVTGTLTQTATGDITAGGAATITVGGDYNIGLVTAGGTITIQSTGGSILDTNGDLLNATTPGSGQITAAGTIGTDTDPIEVQFGGLLNVGAGGSVNGVSINMSGTTGNNDLGLLFAPPNGLVMWNGIIRLVSLESVYGSMDWFIDPQRRRFDPRLHRPLDEESTTEEELLRRRVQRPTRPMR